MNIKKYLLLLICLWALGVQAQKTRPANRNYFKILILNEKDEVLLVEFKEIWEYIGGEYNTTATLQEHVEKLVKSANIEVSDIRLRGLFSIYWNDIDKPDVHHYYTARYKSGDVKTPDDCSASVWADLKKARKLITYKDMLWMYESVLESEQLWGGTYKIVKDKEKGTRDIEKIVDYFKLN